MAISDDGTVLFVTGGSETIESAYAYCQANSLNILTKEFDGAYTFNQRIFLQNDAVFTALSANLRIHKNGGVFVTGNSTATANFGELATVDGIQVARKGCSFYFVPDFTDPSGNDQFNNPLNYAIDDAYGGDESRGNYTRQLNLYACTILWPNNGDQNYIKVSNLIDCSLSGGPGDGKRIVLMPPGAIVRNCRFEGLSCIEMYGPPGEFTSNTFQQMGFNILDYRTGTIIPIRGLKSTGSDRDYWTNTGAFRFIDSVVDLAKGRIDLDTWSSEKAYSINLKFAGNLSGATVQYWDSTGQAYSAVSDATGRVPELIVTVEKTTGWGDPLPSGGGTVVSLNPFNRRIRAYGYRFQDETAIAISEPLGSPTAPFLMALQPDTVAHLSESDALAIAGVAIDYTAQKLTISQTLTISNLYDYLHAKFSQDLTTPEFFRSIDGKTFDCDFDVEVNGCTLAGSGVLNLGAKTFTQVNGGTSQPTVFDSSGILYQVHGLPTTGSPVLRVKRLSTGAIANPSVVSGSAGFKVVPGEDYEVRADAIGYLASRFYTINSNTSNSLEIVLEQIVDGSGNPIYGKGTQAEKDLIAFDPSSLRITIAYSATSPSISLYSAIDKIEELLATPLGLEFTAHPRWDNDKLLFPRDIVTGNPNPARIQAAATNTGIPELLFEVELEGYSKPYPLFDFSNGKIINYPTTVNVAQVSANVSASVDPQAVRNALALPLSSGVSPVVGSIDAKLDTPAPTSGGGLTPTESAQLAAIANRVDAPITSVSASVLTAIVESGLSVQAVLRLLLAVATGKSVIEAGANGSAIVRFRDQSDAKDRIVATMQGSSRSAIVKDPN